MFTADILTTSWECFTLSWLKLLHPYCPLASLMRLSSSGLSSTWSWLLLPFSLCWNNPEFILWLWATFVKKTNKIIPITSGQSEQTNTRSDLAKWSSCCCNKVIVNNKYEVSNTNKCLRLKNCWTWRKCSSLWKVWTVLDPQRNAAVSDFKYKIVAGSWAAAGSVNPSSNCNLRWI